ncbi:sensor histidine kinase [Emcibacter nanhaiensis]|uniref:histidine kinase n=1 Tax=Emcibacter nanhaiensis TaxID=1505037 RepID=A0A501PC94_9PROT|nr:HAMP domain-containing sensor histidine kinase [Emcibacter nanhaiensis]TPD57845.1 HAMP domain-containing histidine kinase [Emcibacter nanhaiensis]
MVETLKYLSLRNRLSNRLLLLTIGFVMLAEVLIYVPSIAGFRLNWLEERLGAAQIAILAIEAAPDYMVGEKLSWELLNSAGVVAIVRKKDDNRELVLGTDKPLNVEARYDIRDTNWWTLVHDAFEAMWHTHPHSRLIEVTGYTSDESMDFLQIIFDEELLCHALYQYSRNVLLVSIIISLMTAALVYVTLSLLLVRPVRKITDSMISFREAPEDTRRQFTPEDRQDEIGVVMKELAMMQDEVRRALNQKTHLANLGIAVSKINHDLRNILASAQLVSDHLSTLKDPTVQKLTPRFVSAVDRAIRLCENTLAYGRAELEKPRLEQVALRPVIDDVAISLGLPEDGPVKILNHLPAALTLSADPDQLFRVFLNLGRNAVQALEQARLNKGEITVSGQTEDSTIVIDFCDNGPGIPARIQEKLFQPFHGSSNGGAGLGLAIAREIIEAHGGRITLTDSGPDGTCFRIELPAG